MTFAVSCIESVAKTKGCTPEEIFFRMKNAGLINNYILKHYETLHTESRENLTQELVEMLQKKEDQSHA